MARPCKVADQPSGKLAPWVSLSMVTNSWRWVAMGSTKALAAIADTTGLPVTLMTTFSQTAGTRIGSVADSQESSTSNSRRIPPTGLEKSSVRIARSATSRNEPLWAAIHRPPLGKETSLMVFPVWLITTPRPRRSASMSAQRSMPPVRGRAGPGTGVAWFGHSQTQPVRLSNCSATSRHGAGSATASRWAEVINKRAGKIIIRGIFQHLGLGACLSFF